MYLTDLPYCPQDDWYAGLYRRIYYAPASWFRKLETSPQIHSLLEMTVDVHQIEMKIGCELKYIDVLYESAHIENQKKGVFGVSKFSSTLEFSLPTHLLPNRIFMYSTVNEPMVFIVPDNNGRSWIVGNLYNPAKQQTNRLSTGQSVEGDSTLQLSYTAQSPLYRLKGEIEAIESVGAFSTGFSNGFA